MSTEGTMTDEKQQVDENDPEYRQQRLEQAEKEAREEAREGALQHGQDQPETMQQETEVPVGPASPATTPQAPNESGTRTQVGSEAQRTPRRSSGNP
jgi:hypothetical protein